MTYLLSVYGFDFCRTSDVTIYYPYDICNVPGVMPACDYGKKSQEITSFQHNKLLIMPIAYHKLLGIFGVIII